MKTPKTHSTCRLCKEIKLVDCFGFSTEGYVRCYCRPCAASKVRERNARLRKAGLCVCCGKAPRPGRTLCEKRSKFIAERTRSIRRQTISLWGGKCVCCQEAELDFLTIDHVHGGGNKHRKKIGVGVKFYAWLRKNHSPDDGEYQVLCMNCNWTRGVLGECPHQKRTLATNREGSPK